MLDASQLESNVAEELCALLQVFPSEVRSRSMAVLTTTPALWTSVGAHAHVVDLSPLFGPSDGTEASVRGSLLTDLSDRIRAYEPDAAIVDFTIPTGVTLPWASSPGGPGFTLPGLLPGDLPEWNRRSPDAYHLFLAWAASIPSVRALSTVAPSSLTTDPEDDWVRQYLFRHPDSNNRSSVSSHRWQRFKTLRYPVLKLLLSSSCIFRGRITLSPCLNYASRSCCTMRRAGI